MMWLLYYCMVICFLTLFVIAANLLHGKLTIDNYIKGIYLLGIIICSPILAIFITPYFIFIQLQD